MRRRLIFAVVLLNLALAGALVASPLASQVFPASFLRDCCKDEGPEGYCCANCCFFTSDCNGDEDCKGL